MPRRYGTRQRILKKKENSLPSVALGKGFTECMGAFAECMGHSAKRVAAVVPSIFPVHAEHLFDTWSMLEGQKQNILLCIGIVAIC